VPDTRHHRGPHPQDLELFAATHWPALGAAVADLSWLLSRGYAVNSALKLVGDRLQLSERQRLAVMRSACAEAALAGRHATQVPAERLADCRMAIDGFNVLTSVEAALAGGVILVARDGCYRDLASMHGSYRKVAETRPALVLIGEVLQELHVAACAWYLDRPVSNSGRLKTILQQLAAERQWSWQAEVAVDVDAVLAQSSDVVASADAGILDRCERWCNLAAEVIRRRVPTARRVPLAG
jgi:hypothetical protein